MTRKILSLGTAAHCSGSLIVYVSQPQYQEHHLLLLHLVSFLRSIACLGLLVVLRPTCDSLLSRLTVPSLLELIDSYHDDRSPVTSLAAYGGLAWHLFSVLVSASSIVSSSCGSVWGFSGLWFPHKVSRLKSGHKAELRTHRIEVRNSLVWGVKVLDAAETGRPYQHRE